MTEPTDQFTDIANRGQDAVSTAVRTWADTVQSFASTLSGGRTALPDLQGVVEQSFEFAEQALAGQRAFAEQWASGTVKAFAAVTEQTQRTQESVVAHTADSAEAVVEDTAETARVAVDEAAATAHDSAHDD